MERKKATQLRRLSSESSSYSCSSGTSYYDWGGSSIISDDDEEEGESNGNHCSNGGRSLKSRSFFDDVKVILSRHDSKLSKFEDDLSCVVRWLNQKFGFILKYESTSSIPSMWDDLEHANVTNSDDPMMMNEGLDNETVTPIPLSDALPLENESFTEENDDNEEGEYSGCNNNYSSHEHHRVNDKTDKKDEQLSLHGITNDDENSGDDSLRAANINVMQNRDFRPTSPENNPSTFATLRDVRSSGPVKQVQSEPEPATGSKKSQRPSQCDTCGKFLKDQSSLRQHKKIHLNIRPFVCTEPDCGKSFRRKFHLQTHTLIHKGVRNHQCGYCGRCFLLQKDLHTHERIHTGEKPYTCRECPKSFTLKSHLVMHIRTHTGEKPYKCDICNKTFAQSNTLRLHKKNLHQEVAGTSTSLPRAPKKSLARKVKGPKKAKEKEPVAVLNATLPSTTAATPAKLPIYRNQSAVLTTFKNIPRITPTVTILQQPMIANQTFELLEPIDTININSAEKIVLTESTINMLSSAMSSSSVMNTGTISNSVPLVSSEILNFPQHILIPRNNNL